MKALVVFDSNFGNTRLIAENIVKQLGKGTELVSAQGFKNSNLTGVKLLVVGSPINEWNPTEHTKKFLSLLKKGQLKGIKAAAFDTRVRLFGGNAAKKIAEALQNAGAEIIVAPQGFYVTGEDGPLADGEIDRSSGWVKQIKKAFKGLPTD
ncbi:MAG: flavodoxin family protein [Candidatus Micrarchaeota archaeon]|nr:flavodoxin family protein [Candidatus Micrarchaeota archaeon]